MGSGNWIVDNLNSALGRRTVRERLAALKKRNGRGKDKGR